MHRWNANSRTFSGILNDEDYETKNHSCSVLQREYCRKLWNSRPLLQCDTVCCSMLQRVAVCCSGAVILINVKNIESQDRCCCVLQWVAVGCSEWQCVAVCCSGLQCVAVCRGALCMSPCKPCCSVLQCVAVCCSVLQCVAVCCSVLQWHSGLNEWRELWNPHTYSPSRMCVCMCVYTTSMRVCMYVCIMKRTLKVKDMIPELHPFSVHYIIIKVRVCIHNIDVVRVGVYI